jgi:hypothetical protein
MAAVDLLARHRIRRSCVESARLAGVRVLSAPMQKRGGKWVCRLCGTELDVEADHVPNVIVSVEEGERVLIVDGIAIHTCCVDGTP